MSLSSFLLGGVTCREELPPNEKGALAALAGSEGLVGVPKENPDPVVAPKPEKLDFESAPDGGVAGAAPNENGLFATSAGAAADAWPNVNPDEPEFDPPNNGFGASLVLDPDDVGGAPKAKGEVDCGAPVCEVLVDMIGALNGRVGSGVLDVFDVGGAPNVKNDGGDGEGALFSVLGEGSAGFG